VLENIDKQSEKLWRTMKDEVSIAIGENDLTGDFLKKNILAYSSFSQALSSRIASKVANKDFSEENLKLIIEDQFDKSSFICDAAAKDILAFYERDPACAFFYQPFLFYKGFIALQIYRVSNTLFNSKNFNMALFFQMRSSEVFGVDIHPSATLGSGIMIDHAHSVVIGETATVGNQVSMLHSVTLGGTGKSKGNRHPKIGDGVMIGAGAKILGNITVGNCSRIASGSVVLKSVPSCKTVAGVPAKEVGDAGCPEPAKTMNQLLNITKI
jgi:serine O-acetyltransferase